MTHYRSIRITQSSPIPQAWAAAQRAINEMLLGCAAEFASYCRAKPNPRFPLDIERQPQLLYGRGLGEDEARGFLRAREQGLVEVKPDSNFLIPRSRACSPNLHLLSRNGNHFRVNSEALIHVAAYGELILDKQWEADRIVFDPFFANDALDLWGYAERSSGSWRDGRIVFVAEIKARVTGGVDNLTNLVATFEALQKEPESTEGSNNHRRKWFELVDIVRTHGAVELLLAADGARWWYEARPKGHSITIHRFN